MFRRLWIRYKHRNNPHLQFAGELRLIAEEAGHDRMYILSAELIRMAQELEKEKKA